MTMRVIFASTILVLGYVVIGVILLEMVMWVMSRLDGRTAARLVRPTRPTFHLRAARHLR